MPIHYDPTRWERVKSDADAWWSGTLDRPLIQVRLTGAEPGRPEPVLPPVRRTVCHGDGASIADVVDQWDYTLSGCRYLGNAFPAVHPDFGPGVLAAFLGAQTHVDDATVWFTPDGDDALEDLTFHFDAHHPWFRRIANLMGAAMDRWQGNVQVGMTDLGGALDVLSSFRPGVWLPLDLYDRPDAVKRATTHLHHRWWDVFSRLNALLRIHNPGYTAWAPLFSSDPYYMLQCDFCYMISPEMFREFALPELAAMCDRLTNPFYHLDGPGQLPHLDALLGIERLKGIQWVPGAGAPTPGHWPEVYRRIRGAGKFAQLFGDFDDFDAIVDALGTGKGLIYIGSVDIHDRARAESFLARHDVPA